MTTPTTPDQPKLKLDIYHVWLAPPGTDPEAADYHRVICTMEDQLRAERELARANVSMKKYPLRLIALLIWASLQRTGDFADDFAKFTAACVNYTSPKSDAADDDDETVIHPTEASTS